MILFSPDAAIMGGTRLHADEGTPLIKPDLIPNQLGEGFGLGDLSVKEKLDEHLKTLQSSVSTVHVLHWAFKKTGWNTDNISNHNFEVHSWVLEKKSWGRLRYWAPVRAWYRVSMEKPRPSC